MIDPGIWTSDQFISLTIRQRLLFIGLISNADDEGRLRGESRKIKALIFPSDHISDLGMEMDLQILTQTKLIHRWQTDGEIFIELPSWKKYQKFNYSVDSHLPKFEQSIEEILTKDLRSVSPQVSKKVSKKERKNKTSPSDETKKPIDKSKILTDVKKFVDNFGCSKEDLEQEDADEIFKLASGLLKVKLNVGRIKQALRGEGGLPYTEKKKFLEIIQKVFDSKCEDPKKGVWHRVQYPANYD